MTFNLAIAGDIQVDGKVSVCEDERFLELLDVFRAADVGYGHLECIIADPDTPQTHPSALPGGIWLNSPGLIADELKWSGFDMLSLASNHALDYSYGGLHSTWDELDRVGIGHAGTGKNLEDARSPALFDSPKGRIALISMTSTFPEWSRAGKIGKNVNGRPGVNPLRHYYEVDSETFESIKEIAFKLGLWITQPTDDELVLLPIGLHFSKTKFVRSQDDTISRKLVEQDRRENLREIEDASQKADYVLVHIHSHEWDPEGDLTNPADFLPPFAKECVDTGADAVIADGSHAPIRGIEIYENKPIFYSPGTLFRMNQTRPTYPAELYYAFEDALDRHPWDATPTEGRAALYDDTAVPLNPEGGYRQGRPEASIVPVCEFDDHDISRIELHPIRRLESPIGHQGIPIRPNEAQTEEILEHVQDLCRDYGTDVDIEDGIGIIDA